jgi:hypothetical protein
MARDEDIIEMFDDYDSLASQHGQSVLGPYLRMVVARLVGQHIGILRHTLYQVYKVRAEGDATVDSEVVNLLLHSKFHFLLQGLRVSYDVLQFPAELLGILNMALDGPVTSPSYPMSASEPYFRLLDLGLFVTVDENAFQFASPLIRRIVFNQLYCSLSRPSEAPQNLIEFVMQSLRLLSSDVLERTLATLTSGAPREDVWQKEFYRVASSLLPTSNILSAEVGRIFGTGSDDLKSVDFYVDHNLKWMVEFVAEGSDLKGHLDRFDTNGRYRNIPRNDWLIVDFRVKVGPPKKFKPRVLYLLCDDDRRAATACGDMIDSEVRVVFRKELIRTLSDL